MIDYCVGVRRACGQFPHQVLLYVGQGPMRMDAAMRGPGLEYRYHAVDVRDLDGEALLNSESVADNVIAILTRLRDHRKAVREAARRIAKLETGEQRSTVSLLMTLAGLRNLDEVVEQEITQMPITTDIMEHKVFNRVHREGELRVLRRQIRERFGEIPEWAEEKLKSATYLELEEFGSRLLRAATLEEMLG